MYSIIRAEGSVRVFFSSTERRPREITPDASQKLMNHSPDGFEFGFFGSGPAQLALAILLDYFKGKAPAPKEAALEHYHAFKVGFIANQKEDAFTISQRAITRWFAARILTQENKNVA